jgi:hypothetical protein
MLYMSVTNACISSVLIVCNISEIFGISLYQLLMAEILMV